MPSDDAPSEPMDQRPATGKHPITGPQPPDSRDEPAGVDRVREYPTRGLPLVLVLVAVAASLLLLLVDFRLGAAVLAGSVGTALLLRMILPEARAGLLVVRGRAFDIGFLGALTVALALLAVIVPAPPG